MYKNYSKFKQFNALKFCKFEAGFAPVWYTVQPDIEYVL